MKTENIIKHRKGAVIIGLLSAIILIGVTLALTYPEPLMAADGKTLYSQKICQTCHGMEGKRPIAPMYPRLNGQNSIYCQNQIKDIRSGKRNNGLSMTMKPMVAALSNADMKAICDYLSKVK